MIRRATWEDRCDVVRLMRDFHAAVRIAPFEFSPVHVEQYFHGVLLNPDSLAIVLDVNGAAQGLLAATVVSHPWADFKVASEIAWWIDPDHRGKGWRAMIVTYEDWAREHGAQTASLTEFAEMPVGALYRAKGYTLAESTHVKVLR